MNAPAPAATLPAGVEISAPISTDFARSSRRKRSRSSPSCTASSKARRQELLARRAARQKEFDAGKLPDFLPETKSIRESKWTIAAQPQDLLDRRVEITGPTDRKMVINALNCGASTFMADFEDANCPTWDNMIDGQINLRDAVRRTITLEQGRQAVQAERQDRGADPAPARLAPRREARARSTASPSPARIFDFALLFFHNAKELLARGSGPYFYLPKMEIASRGAALERHLHDGAERARRAAGHDQGDRADRDGARRVRDGRDPVGAEGPLAPASTSGAGTTSSRASRSSASNQDFCLADRAQVTMTAPFMRAYALTLVKTCHRRNAPAMGGMAAQIPIKNDPAANEAALEKVRAGQAARGDRRLRRHLGRAPGPGADREGGVRPAHADAEPVRASSAPT